MPYVFSLDELQSRRKCLSLIAREPALKKSTLKTERVGRWRNRCLAHVIACRQLCPQKWPIHRFPIHVNHEVAEQPDPDIGRGFNVAKSDWLIKKESDAFS